MDLQLSGRVAVVTGGSMGIGKAIAHGLAEEGVVVAICARSRAAVEAAAADISSASGRAVHPYVTDVTRRSDVDAMMEDVAGRFGRLDILVNNAGIPGGAEKGPLHVVSDEGVLKDLDTKYVGYLRCARAAAPYMQKQGWGRIINIGGYAQLAASAYSTGARNMAVVHLSRILSLELARDGVTSNVVHPGATRTERTDQLWAETAEREGIAIEDVIARYDVGNDYRRWMEAKEVADLVVFLASPRSTAVTGETIGAGGGARPAMFM
jgi:NAD(P)-dependent dehydrogenase (short-subunit alcohol dehydrogenase family)